MDYSKLKSDIRHRSFNPIENYKSMITFYASRSQIRKTNPTTAKISMYHILENKYTGQDICYDIINTDVQLNRIHSCIKLNNVIPVLSPILELFKNKHNRYNYLNKLKYVITRNDEKYLKQKYKNQIHIRSLQAFFNLLLHEIVPTELFGTTKNIKIIKKTIYNLLKTVPKSMPITQSFKRKMSKCKANVGASLSIEPLLNKLDISKIKWLRPIEKNNMKRWIIIIKLLHWFFAQYIIKILHKHVVLMAVRKQWIYIGKDDWCKMQEEFMKEKENINHLMISVTLDKPHRIVPIGTYKFIPSASGLRALLITKYDIQTRKLDIDVVLRFLQQLYVTFINEHGICTVATCLQNAFKFRQSTTTKLYYVRCDIQDAFGSIIQEKLFDIITTYCKKLDKTYLIMRKCTLEKIIKINNMKRTHKVQTVKFGDLKEISMYKYVTLNKEKNLLVKITKLAKLIKKLIFMQQIKVKGKIYLIKFGVPQGIPTSPILSDIYYQYMFNDVFSKYAANGCLCTYVDDILYITENKNYAAEFLEIVRNGIPEYNVKFNPNKIESNIDLPHKDTRIKFLGQYIKL